MNSSINKYIIFTIVILIFQSPLFVVAQEIQPFQFQSVTILPKLSGAATFEASFEPRFQLTRQSDAIPSGLGVGGGYSFFFDPHGRQRFRLIVDTSLAGANDDTSLFGLGGTATYSMRGYSPNFAFASFGLSVTARYLNYSGPAESNSGFEAGVGIELSLGSLFYDQPYLFGAFSNSVFVTYNNINNAVALFGRVGIRFDWAFRDRSVQGYIWE